MLEHTGYECPKCGRRIVPLRTRAVSRVVLFLGLSLLGWATDFSSKIPVPHPWRVGLLFTSAAFVFFIGGLLLELWFGKVGPWMAVAIIVGAGALLQPWAMS